MEYIIISNLIWLLQMCGKCSGQHGLVCLVTFGLILMIVGAAQMAFQPSTIGMTGLEELGYHLFLILGALVFIIGGIVILILIIGDTV